MESFEEFEEWFQRQGKDVRNLISIRALIREFPLLDAAEIKLAFDQKAKTRFVLAALRCLTAAGSVMVNPSPETQKAARAAAQAADRMVTDAFAGGDTGDDLANPNYEAIHPNAEILRRALRLATDVSSEDGVKKAIRPTAEMQDAMLADSEVEFDKLMATPLWGIAGEPEWLSTDAPHAHRLTASGDQWRFWRDWYQGFLDGKPLDWELQRRVALIPDEDWEKGPEHIAEIIEKIRLQFKTQTTPPLVRDEEREIFTVESDDTLPRDVLEFACTRITIAYDAAIDASSENGFREDSYEASLIQRALTEFATHPSLLATSFFDACLSFQRTIGERYPEDTSLINLQNALYGVVEEINEQHEDARHRCARLAKLAQPEPISVDDMQALKEVPDMVADQVDTHAGQIIESDVERMLSTPNPPKSVRARFTNWITTISMWMDKAMKGDKRAQWLAGLVGRLIKWFPGGE